MPGARIDQTAELSAMKHKTPILVFALLLSVPMLAAAQTQTRSRRSTEPAQDTINVSPVQRERVVAGKVLNHAEPRKAVPETNAGSNVDSQKPVQDWQTSWGNKSIIVSANPTVAVSSAGSGAGVTPVIDSGNQPKKLVQTTSLPATQSANASLRMVRPAGVGASASIYTVGIGDVLDVRLSNLRTRESTLFTVMKNGTLEYPLLGGPISVVGMTTDEIANLLNREIKVIKAPRVTVTVRDYASHAVVVTGSVDNPGRKILRREAMPLFAVLAESLVRADATLATIVRNGKDFEAIKLRDERAMATLVLPGDVIRISGAESVARSFVYVGGAVISPGEKLFRDGMTLTQAVLAAGGAPRSDRTIIRLARRNASGFLTTNEYSLRAIEEGKAPDPALEAGDRIEVVRGT